MYKLFLFIENLNRYINNQLKIIYWKLKYGKRISIGKNLRFRKGLIINISKDGCLKIGNNNFFNNYCSINCHKYINIGDNNLFGENAKIYDHNHIFNNLNIDMMKEFYCHEIIIGNNNWIGSGSIILSKTELGNHNVIGAGVVLNEKYENGMMVRKEKQFEEKINFKY